MPAKVPPSTAATETTFAGFGGVQLFERSWAPPGSPHGCFVIVHGIKDHSGRYGELAEALTSRGIAVRAFDLRGHGKSEGKRISVRSFGEYLNDVDIELKRAREANPGKPLFLFGHSMGGAIVTNYTLTFHPDLQGLVLSAPALMAGADFSKFLIKITKFLGKAIPGARVFKSPTESFSRDPAVVAGMHSDPLVYRTPGTARLAAELLKAIEFIQAHQAELRVPLLALHGTADKLTNPAGSRTLVERAASNDKTLKILEGAWHDLAHEPEHAEFTREIVEWVSKRA